MVCKSIGSTQSHGPGGWGVELLVRDTKGALHFYNVHDAFELENHTVCIKMLDS